MTAYYFRVVDDSKPNGWIGFAMAETIQHLFWTIDEFVDPYSVEIKTAKVAGYCYHAEVVDGWTLNRSDYETSESEPFLHEDAWSKPVWVTDESFDVNL